MNVEPRSMSPHHYHFYEGVIYEAFLFGHFEDMGSKNFGQWADINLRHNEEIATLMEETMGHQRMKVRVPTSVVSGGLNSDDNSGYACFLN